MSSGIYRRVRSAVCRRYCLASKCRRRDACVTITQNAPLDLGPPPRRTPALRATRGAARARKRLCPITKTAADSFSHRGRTGPVEAMPISTGPVVGWAAAGSCPQAALGRFPTSSPDLTVLIRHDIGRLSKQRVRRLACSTQLICRQDVDSEDDANIETVARQLATPRDRLGCHLSVTSHTPRVHVRRLERRPPDLARAATG